MTAAHSVLYAPELLTQILHLIPISDLLVTAQRVDRTWRSLIQNTLSLQKAFFLAPSHEEPPSLNPFLKRFPFFESAVVGVSFRNGNGFLWYLNPEVFKRSEASWREMLLMSNGGVFGVVARRPWRGGDSVLRASIKGVLTMGALWALAGQMKGDGWRSLEVFVRGQEGSVRRRRIFVGPREVDGGEIGLWRVGVCCVDWFEGIRERREMWRAWMGEDDGEEEGLGEVVVRWEPSLPVSVLWGLVCGGAWDYREPSWCEKKFDSVRKYLKRAFGVVFLPKLPAVS